MSSSSAGKKDVNERDFALNCLAESGIFGRQDLQDADNEMRDKVYELMWIPILDMLLVQVTRLYDKNFKEKTIVFIDEELEGFDNHFIPRLIEQFTSGMDIEKQKKFVEAVIFSLKNFVVDNERTFGEWGTLTIHEERLAFKVSVKKKSNFTLPKDWQKVKSVPLSDKQKAILKRHNEISRGGE